MNNQVLNGKVSFNRNILLSIVTLAAKEVSGVAGLVENFNGLFKKYDGGVKISYFNNNTRIVIDVFICIQYGYSVNDVSARVQENIKSCVNAMLNVEIESVNIHIVGVDFSSEHE